MCCLFGTLDLVIHMIKTTGDQKVMQPHANAVFFISKLTILRV
jgi:hypothetical protein